MENTKNFTQQELVEILRSGSAAWNDFVAQKRASDPEWHADLEGADLREFDLRGAHLAHADLENASLACANLKGANLWYANLKGAKLDSAKLDSANLYGANLQGANLQGSRLYGANLPHANLASADLSDANLNGANLSGACLYNANLEGVSLESAKSDLFVGLLHNPAKVADLKEALQTGDLSTHLSRFAVASRLLGAIGDGDTPDTNPVSALATDWLLEFEELVAAAAKKLGEA